MLTPIDVNLHERLRDHAFAVEFVAALEEQQRASDRRARQRIAELEKRPTRDAYDAACKALHHWREEAARLAELSGVEPRQMEH